MSDSIMNREQVEVETQLASQKASYVAPGLFALDLKSTNSGGSVVGDGTASMS